jgi:hypothetical protein
MDKDEALKLALEALEGADEIDCDMRDAIKAIKQARSAPYVALPRVQGDVTEILDRLEVFVGGLGKAILRELRIALAEQPAQRTWMPITKELLNEQHPWLYQPMWIAMKDGTVIQGYYEWRQGRNPDRFRTGMRDEWAFDAAYVMPIVKPTHPDKEKP